MPKKRNYYIETLYSHYEHTMFVEPLDITGEIIKEKYTISPNCKTCPTPCGNTSDYDMAKFIPNLELKTVKEELIAETVALATRINNSLKTKLPEAIYKAISFFGYELSVDSYKDLINTLKKMEV